MKSTSCIKKSVKKIVKKTPDKIPYTMKIHNSLEHIRKTKLSNLSLFELSVHFNMPFDLSKELRRRIELIQILLEDGAPNSALDIINNLLKKPL